MLVLNHLLDSVYMVHVFSSSCSDLCKHCISFFHNCPNVLIEAIPDGLVATRGLSYCLHKLSIDYHLNCPVELEQGPSVNWLRHERFVAQIYLHLGWRFHDWREPIE